MKRNLQNSKTDFKALRALRDDDIDTSEAPVPGPEFWENAFIRLPGKGRGKIVNGKFVSAVKIDRNPAGTGRVARPSKKKS